MLTKTIISVAVYLLALIPTLSEARGNETAHAYAREESLLTEHKAALSYPAVSTDGAATSDGVVTSDGAVATATLPDVLTAATSETNVFAVSAPDTVTTNASAATSTQQPQRRYWTVTGAPYIDEPVPAGRRPVIGLSTNLLYYVATVPSIGIEFYPARGHWTFGADLDFSHWMIRASHFYNQIHNITLSTRRYFRSSDSYTTARRHKSDSPAVSSFYGLYLTGNVNAVQYGLGWDAHGWEGEGLGVGIGIGYKWQLDRRMYLDLGATAGFFYSRYDPYVWGNDDTGWYYYDYNGDPRDFVPRRMALRWFGPTRVYISLGVNIFDRNNKRR